jgi:alcohol dehydrogenase
MRAVQYEEFRGLLRVVDVPEPVLPPHGAIIEVRAGGMCRSDWHGWQRNDPDIVLPHIPGHEWAGVVVAVGDTVARWRGGERVTAPFVCGCGSCDWCARGDQQVCMNQTQPGFTHSGAFAERLVVNHADVNLVGLPDSVDFVTAASLGCRFATAFRAIAQQGRPGPGDWVAIHGCGGASLSLDAFGSVVTSLSSLYSLGRRGRHIQVGALPPTVSVPMPMHRVMGWELEIVGSHGMAAHTYREMLAAVTAGSLRPDRLVTRRVGLEDVCELLPLFSEPARPGITVVEMGDRG